MNIATTLKLCAGDRAVIRTMPGVQRTDIPKKGSDRNQTWIELCLTDGEPTSSLAGADAIGLFFPEDEFNIFLQGCNQIASKPLAPEEGLEEEDIPRVTRWEMDLTNAFGPDSRTKVRVTLDLGDDDGVVTLYVRTRLGNGKRYEERFYLLDDDLKALYKVGDRFCDNLNQLLGW